MVIKCPGGKKPILKGKITLDKKDTRFAVCGNVVFKTENIGKLKKKVEVIL